MTNAAIAAALMAGGLDTPQEWEELTTRILTCKGTVAQPTGGCGVGCSSTSTVGRDAAADLTCALGADTPQDCEQVGLIITTRGQRTDTLNY